MRSKRRPTFRGRLPGGRLANHKHYLHLRSQCPCRRTLRQTDILENPAGFASFEFVIGQGGLTAYFRHVWRFGLFFLFPFVLMGVVLAASLVVAALPGWLGFRPWHFVWSLPLAWGFYRLVSSRLSSSFRTVSHALLGCRLELAVSVARVNGPELGRWLERHYRTVIEALNEPADEYLISSHSMG
jgi:hypothetical protein